MGCAMPSIPGTASRPHRRAARLSRRSFLRLLAIGSAGLVGCGLAPRAPIPSPGTLTPAPRPSLVPAPHVEAGRVIPVDDLYVKSYLRTPEPVPRENWEIMLGGQMRQ